MTTFFLTFVSSKTVLQDHHFDIVGDYLELNWLADGVAADISLAQKPSVSALAYIRAQLEAEEIDVFVSSAENRRKKLLLADMDSTIVTGETLDDLAGFAGIKDKIAAITARAMNGELDFHDAIRERVGLLKGLNTDALDGALTETTLTAGATTFVQTMKKFGATCVLVSGGFTFFTEAIARQTGFDHHHGNQLGIDGNALSGQVIDPILDKDSKLAFLNEYCAQQGLSLDEALTIGDGANDLPMLQAAGMGLGFHAKPSVAAQLENVIRFGDLTSALYAQGFTKDEFAS